MKRKLLSFRDCIASLVKGTMIRRNYPTILLSLFLLVTVVSRAQLTVPDYSACPNQTIMVTATWNNVSNITYTLTPGNIIQGNNPNFIVTTPTTTTSYTICAVGSSLGLPTNSCDQFIIFVNVPPPLTLTNQVNYCHGDVGVITAPVGGGTYSLSGPPGVAPTTALSNVITIPNMANVPHTGTYTVTTILNGCVSSGTTNIFVAPNHQITVNSPSNVCLGQVVSLTAAMPTATLFTWTGNNYNSPPDPTTFFCNSMSQSGQYQVSAYINFNGITCLRTATTSITIVETAPVIASASPSTTICEGNNINLTAGVLTQAIPQGYNWQGPQSYNSSLQSPVLTAATPNMSGAYTVTAIFFNSAVTCTTSAVVSISVIAIAQPIINSTSDVCQGGTANFSVSASGTNSYSWTGPANFASTQSFFQISNAQPNQGGVYFAYAYFGPSQQCVTTKSVQLNVVATNSISVIPPGQVCEPNNAYLQANSIGATSYAWTGPNGFGPVPSANAVVYYPTPSASGIYTVTAYFANAAVTCSSTSTASLVVNPLLNFSITPYQILCYNTPLTINGPAGATSYSWTSSSGVASNNQNLQIAAAQPNHSGSYTLQVSLGPCVTTGTTLVEVLTPIQFTLTPNDRTVCRGESILLEAGASGGSQNYAFTYNPSIYLSSPVGATQTGVPLGTTVYNLLAYDNACPNYSISHIFTVSVLQPPMPDFLDTMDIQGCDPFTIHLEPHTQATAAMTTYDFGNNLVYQVDGDSTFYYTFPGPGSYTMNVYSLGENGCKGEYLYPFPIVVFPKPGTSIFWEPESPTVTDNIILNTSNNVQPVEFTWMISNPSVTGYDTSRAAVPEVSYDEAGFYPVIVITRTENNCMDTVERVIEVKDNYNVFIPNTFTPNGDGLNDVFMVKGSGLKPDGFQMDITDRWGTVVFTTNEIDKGWDGTVNGQEAKDGVYIYKIRATGANGEGRKDFLGYVNLIK